MTMYSYRAQLLKVVDADTLDVDVDLGLDAHLLLRVRLAGLNAPESRTETGKLATAFVESWMKDVADQGALTITTVKDRREKFGRYLAYVHPYTTLGLPTSLNQTLIDTGHAVAWDGKGPRP